MSSRKKKQAAAKDSSDANDVVDEDRSSNKKQPNIARFFKSSSDAKAFGGVGSVEEEEEKKSAYVQSSYSHVRDHVASPAPIKDDTVVSSIMHLFVPPTHHPSQEDDGDDDCLLSKTDADARAAPEMDMDPRSQAPHPYAFVFDKSRQCNYSSIPFEEARGGPDASTACSSMGGLGAGAGAPAGAGSGAPGPGPGAPAYKNNHGVTRLLADFGEKSRNGEWPSSTNVSCYWCCHKFIGVPFGLPTKMNVDAERKFHVIGCFCSLECACAYNFSSRENTDERLARYTLVNSMAARMGFTDMVPVKPAPDRLALDMFGGHMTIEEFRRTTDKHVIVNTTPMLSVVQQAEELNEQDMHSEYRYISLDKNRVCKFQEKIKLKRSKPLIGSNKVTLDQSMKLTFKNV
jgi:hypothetical protein